jgi:hypothetical protein
MTLREVEGDGRPWTGHGAAEDIAKDETVQVLIASDSPPPLNRVNDVEFTAVRG